MVYSAEATAEEATAEKAVAEEAAAERAEVKWAAALALEKAVEERRDEFSAATEKRGAERAAKKAVPCHYVAVGPSWQCGGLRQDPPAQTIENTAQHYHSALFRQLIEA